MRRPIRLLSVAALLALATLAVADSPLPPPSKTEFRSRNGRFLAVSGPETWVTTVLEREPSTGALQKRWSMYGWVRQAWLADDGTHLLIVADGQNLVPLDFKLDDPVLYLVRRGELVKTVSLMEVVGKATNLRRTVSHYAWGHFLGTDPSGRFRVETPDGGIFFMDLATGATGREPPALEKSNKGRSRPRPPATPSGQAP